MDVIYESEDKEYSDLVDALLENKCEIKYVERNGYFPLEIEGESECWLYDQSIDH